MPDIEPVSDWLWMFSRFPSAAPLSRDTVTHSGMTKGNWTEKAGEKYADRLQELRKKCNKKRELQKCKAVCDNEFCITLRQRQPVVKVSPEGNSKA